MNRPRKTPQKTPQKIRTLAGGPAALLLAALLLALPFAAAGQEPEAVPEPEKVEVKKDLEVHRVVLAPGEETVRIVNLPAGAEGAEGAEGKRMHVVVRTSQDGEGEPRSWVWNEESGETFQVGPDAKMFFATRVPRAYLGLQLTDLSPDLRTHFGSQEDRGVLVGKVLPDTPASRAGLRVGDVLTHLDGQPVGSSFDLTTRLGNRKEGEVVALEVIRDGKVETLSATLEVRERPQIDVGQLLHQLDLGDGKAWSFQVGDDATWEFDAEALEKKLDGVRVFLDSDEWRQQMQQMEVELREELETMEVELEELEKHLQELDLDIDVQLDEKEVEVEVDEP